MKKSEKPFNEDDKYDEFPRGSRIGAGPAQGFNTLKRLNDESLFTPEALEDPAIRAFVDAPFSVTFIQLKSSTRESEWFLHKPHLAMAGKVKGIKGTVSGFRAADPHIATYVINHERTLAWMIWRSLIIEDGTGAAQMIHKQNYEGTGPGDATPAEAGS